VSLRSPHRSYVLLGFSKGGTPLARGQRTRKILCLFSQKTPRGDSPLQIDTLDLFFSTSAVPLLVLPVALPGNICSSLIKSLFFRPFHRWSQAWLLGVRPVLSFLIFRPKKKISFAFFLPYQVLCPGKEGRSSLRGPPWQVLNVLHGPQQGGPPPGPMSKSYFLRIFPSPADGTPLFSPLPWAILSPFRTLDILILWNVSLISSRAVLAE